MFPLCFDSKALISPDKQVFSPSADTRLLAQMCCVLTVFYTFIFTILLRQTIVCAQLLLFFLKWQQNQKHFKLLFELLVQEKHHSLGKVKQNVNISSPPPLILFFFFFLKNYVKSCRVNSIFFYYFLKCTLLIYCYQNENSSKMTGTVNAAQL